MKRAQRKRLKYPLKAEKKRALVLLEAKWFVKEQEPVGPNADGERYTGGREENRNDEVLFPLGGRSHLLEHSAPMSVSEDDNETKSSANMNKHMAFVCVCVCVTLLLMCHVTESDFMYYSN